MSFPLSNPLKFSDFLDFSNSFIHLSPAFHLYSFTFIHILLIPIPSFSSLSCPPYFFLTLPLFSSLPLSHSLLCSYSSIKLIQSKLDSPPIFPIFLTPPLLPFLPFFPRAFPFFPISSLSHTFSACLYAGIPPLIHPCFFSRIFRILAPRI